MGDYEDYFQDFDVMFDFDDFNNAEQYFDKMKQSFKPINFGSWNEDSVDKLEQQALDRFDIKSDKEPNIIEKARELLQTTKKTLTDRRKALLISANKKFSTGTKLKKAELNEARRIVFLKASELQKQSNLTREQASSEAWRFVKAGGR